MHHAEASTLIPSPHFPKPPPPCRRKWSTLSVTCLELCKCFERRLWPDQHLLRQFENQLSPEILSKVWGWG